jgi:ABC-type thiamin/hydroxymethylpyrimidine transport system permease subunit
MTDKAKRRIKIILVPLVPAVFAILYDPINRGYVVKALGCGCVDGFNANSLNGILFIGVWIVSAVLLAWASRPLPGGKRALYLACGLILQALTTYFAWKHSLWR